MIPPGSPPFPPPDPRGRRPAGSDGSSGPTGPGGRTGPPGPGALLRRYCAAAPATSIIVALTCVAWLAMMLQQGASEPGWHSPLARHLLLWGPEVARGGVEWLRLAGYALVHAGTGHLIANMALLTVVGPTVERWAGSALLAAGYVLSAVTGGLAVLALDPATPTVGASGAVYGMMVVLIAVVRDRRESLRAPVALLAANIVYSLLVPGISLWAHLGGVAGGIVVALLALGRARRRRRR